MLKNIFTNVFDQLYHNIEIILVNDGSPDKSGKIIDRLAKTDERIKVVHQKNAGVSAARNAGLAAAVGEYVLFIDGDDYVEKEYAQYFFNLINNSNADMAVSLNHFTPYSNRQTRKDNIEVWNNIQVMEAIYVDKINVAVWNKIYKKSIIDKYGIIFHPDIWFGEGMLFNIEYLQHINCIAIGEKKVYHQVYNPNSAMRNFNLESQFCGLRYLDMQKATWKKKTPQLESAWKYHRRNFAKHIILGLVNTNEVKNHQELYNKCKKEMRRNMILPWKVDISLKKKAKLTLFSLFPYMISRHGKRKSEKLNKHDKLLSM